MMKMQTWLAMAALAAGISLGSTNLWAQAQDTTGGTGGRPNFRNMTPEERQQAMMNNIKEQLEIKDDAEWKAIQPLVQKVMEARRGSGGMGRRMFGPGAGGRRNAGDNAGNQGGQRRGGGFQAPTPSPEAEALQKVIDAKAPKAEVKAALARYVESRKAKQAELESVQAELRKVLTTRQEAIATLDGLL
jgi:hypothetical protein